MFEKLDELFKGKRILILGLGKEGKSTYRLLKKFIDSDLMAIADRNGNVFKNEKTDIEISCKTISGEGYLEVLRDFDVIIKTPGIPKTLLLDKVSPNRLTSQTDLFLKIFSGQTIGITGTKGKSTTSSLIAAMFSEYSENTLLVGNIGIPPFDFYNKIDKQTRIVYELSSHQLDDVSHSPHIAVILNIFQEHLDHYHSFEKYLQAKLNIAAFQNPDDWLIFNDEDVYLKNIGRKYDLKAGVVKYSISVGKGMDIFRVEGDQIQYNIGNQMGQFDFSSRSALPGEHNLKNIMAAVGVAKILRIPDEIIRNSVNAFKGLEHRLEFAGEFKGILFYNDSIATVPEATLAALKTLKEVDTLILGGKDRGIDYSGLEKFLPVSGVRNFIFMGDAGRRIHDHMKLKFGKEQKAFMITAFDEIASIILQHTRPGKICLLSPAASSYDMFGNFEERGRMFKKIAGNL